MRWARCATILVGPAVLVTAATLGGCAVEDTLPVPDCHTGDALLITAQSVASASRVPCLRGLPDGWIAATVAIDQSGTTVTFDSDRVGPAAAVLTYDATCDVPGVGASAQPGEPEERLVVFEGGCVRWQLHRSGERVPRVTEDLVARLELVDRLALADEVRRTFVDADL